MMKFWFKDRLGPLTFFDFATIAICAIGVGSLVDIFSFWWFASLLIYFVVSGLLVPTMQDEVARQEYLDREYDDYINHINHINDRQKDP